jgi:hypothetical protein
VQDGHGTHDARLMGEVDLEIDAEVAVRDEIVLVKGLAFHGRQGIVKQSLVDELGSTGSGLVRRLVDVQSSHVRVELGRFASSAADTLACDHTYSSHDGVSHRVLLTRDLVKTLVATITSDGDDFDGLSGRSFDDDAANASAAALSLCLSSDLLGHLHEARYVVVRENFLLGAADDARVRAEGVGLAVDGWPVLLRPLFGLLCAGGREQRKGDLSEDEREAVIDEGRVGEEDLGKGVFTNAADGTNDQVQGGRDTTPAFVAR